MVMEMVKMLLIKMERLLDFKPNLKIEEEQKQVD
jgi:hypothetical protein